MKVNTKRWIAWLLIFSLTAVLLPACGSGKQEEQIEIQTEETTVPPTEPPKPVTKADGNAQSLLCKDSYSDSANADVVVASVGQAELTNRQLRIAYQMEVGTHRRKNDVPQPDYGLPLDAQLCPLSDRQISWQHYFLACALANWHTRQALYQQSQQPYTIVEKGYKEEATTHETYFTEELPAYPVAYVSKSHFSPNSMHQAYLDGIPDLVKTFAYDHGFPSADAMAEALGGQGASAKDVEDYVWLNNMAYIYFTEQTFHMQPTEEEQAALDAMDTGSEKRVTLRHCLLIPEGATVAENGKVTANEDAWAASQEAADGLMEEWNKSWKTRRNADASFAELANANSADKGTQLNGGRLTRIAKGQLHPELDKWCFTPERQYGDTAILRTDLGMEMVFFIKAETNEKIEAEAVQQMEKFRSAVEAMEMAYPMTVDYSKICLMEEAPDVDSDELLYADVAHERFPEIPVYLQQDYAPTMFGGYQLSRYGCGITTMAMIASYMCDELLTPGDMATRYPGYASATGTDGNIFEHTAAELGYFCDHRTWDWKEVEDSLNQGRVAVSLQFHGYFTKTGHYIALQRMTEDGRVVVRDSNIYNYNRLPEHRGADCFDVERVTKNSSVYWLFQPKITRIPACSRCGDPEGCGMPQSLLNQDYICEKCQKALERRNDFLNLNMG